MPEATARKPLDPMGAWLAILLAGIGAFVDAVGYLMLFHTFVAHLSGDTINTGIHLGQREWATAFHRAFPIPCFVLGALLGAAVAEVFARLRMRSIFALPLGLEFLLLLLFLCLGAPAVHDGRLRPRSAVSFYALVALVAGAMGLQSAVLWRVGGTKVRTTFVTGVLVSFTEEVVKYLFWLHDKNQPRRATFLFRISPKDASFRRIVFLFGLWLAYFAGAIAGVCAHLRWTLYCLVAPLVGVLLAIAIDLIHPIMPPE